MIPDTGLPIEAALGAVRAALATRRSAVVAAPPGSGKTTVLPLRLLEHGWAAGDDRASASGGSPGGIVVLEPRRIAARAAARRMAETLGEPVGETVGLVTRDERRAGPRTRLQVLTEGVLTRRLQQDPSLEGTDLVIFDEFHERSLQADLGLALALQAREILRPDLRLLVMSATLDADALAQLLAPRDGAGEAVPVPVVTSAGTEHPVEVRWRPRGQRDKLEPAVVSAVREALLRGGPGGSAGAAGQPGDVLVFLPGAGEIHRCLEALASAPGLADRRDVDLLALYGALPAAEQDRAIAAPVPGRTKVVLATDVAETSITVPGVRVVVDAGLARTPRFDPRTGMTRLVTVAASRASTEQRAGRAGRTGPGTVIRLWSKVEHAARPRFAPAEITQVDLAGLALDLARWGTARPDHLAWLDRPPAASWDEGRALLRTLGALDEAGRLTTQGRAMGELPLHPRLARMVVIGAASGRGWEACLIASLLDDRDILRGRPDDLSADLGERLALLVDPNRRHAQADGRGIRSARTRAEELARRAGLAPGSDPDLGAAGRLLALAYPDRIAQRREARGRFRLRSGSGAWLSPQDPLAGEAFLVAADLDGHRREARVRLGAPISANEVAEVLAGEVEHHRSLEWDRERDDLVARVESRVDGLRLGGGTTRPDPGPATVAALLDRTRARGLDSLPWTEKARQLQHRLAFLRHHQGDEWPALDDATLRRNLDEWLGPYLASATGRRDLERLDLVGILSAQLDFDHQVALAELAPTHLTFGAKESGRESRHYGSREGRARRVPVDYGEAVPVVAVRVQALFGTTATPTVLAGRVPVVLELLSPADRPIQRTSDLAGFWVGSWHAVRKELAGRYPKHAWPEDPSQP